MDNSNINYLIIPMVVIEKSNDENYHSSYLIINLKDRSVNRVSSLSNLYLLKNNNQINNVLEKFF